ncbi:DUF4384 domain-containing protein [Brachyspira aalborgi]|uniref:DUF4384 domain-containing protein n=1 Tax=Brachyspira aalborgi TaxID=29522 RepID=UPI001F54B2EB|nr:DUF4384 domain-containing protein [Brachyspira aalborgi]
MKFKISNILKYIILLFILYLSLYPQEKFKEKKLKVATIDLDNHFKENKPLRKEIVRTINRYHYLKQKMTISVDREKKYLFGTNQLNLKNGLTVASNLNVRIAIIIKSERILITNNTATNKIGDSNQAGTNFGFSNNLKDAFNQIFENYKIVEDTILNNLFFTNNNNTNLSNNLRNEKRYNNNNNENEEEKFELKYNFNVIDIERNDILKEYKLVSSNQAMTTIQNISDYLEAYFAKLVFDSVEPKKNDININFTIEKISSGNRTNSIYYNGNVTEGDFINLKFNPNKNGYLYIFALQNNGNMILMHPNDFNNFINNNNVQKEEIEANKNYSIPPENSKFSIIVSPVNIEEEKLKIKNIDSFYAIYTKRKQGWITARYFNGDGFKICPKNKTADFAFKLKNKLKLKYEWQISKIYLNVFSKINK